MLRSWKVYKRYNFTLKIQVQDQSNHNKKELCFEVLVTRKKPKKTINLMKYLMAIKRLLWNKNLS